ncbi:hypothetical protein D3C78_1346070 [compost metagenome]
MYASAGWGEVVSFSATALGTLAGLSFPASTLVTSAHPSPDGTLLAVAVTDNVSEARVVVLDTTDWSVAQTINATGFYTPFDVVGWAWDSQVLVIHGYGGTSPRWYARNGDDTFTYVGAQIGSTNAGSVVAPGVYRHVTTSDYSVPPGGHDGVRTYSLDDGSVVRTLRRAGSAAALSGTTVFAPTVPLLGPTPAAQPFWTNFKRTTEIVG